MILLGMTLPNQPALLRSALSNKFRKQKEELGIELCQIQRANFVNIDLKKTSEVSRCLFDEVSASAMHEQLGKLFPPVLCTIISEYFVSDWKPKESCIIDDGTYGEGSCIRHIHLMYKGQPAVFWRSLSHPYIIAWDPRKGKVHDTFKAPMYGVAAFAYSPKHKIFVASHDKTIRLSRINTNDLAKAHYFKTIADHDEYASSIVVSPDETQFAVGLANQRICVWSLPDAIMHATYDINEYVEKQIISWNYDGTLLVAKGGHSVRVWNVQDKCLTLNLPFSGESGDVACSPVTNHMIVAPGKEEMHLVDLVTGKTIRSMKPLGSDSRVTWSPHGHYVVSTSITWSKGAMSSNLCMFDVQTGKLLIQPAECAWYHYGSVHFLSDNVLVAISSSGKTTIFSDLD